MQHSRLTDQWRWHRDETEGSGKRGTCETSELNDYTSLSYYDMCSLNTDLSICFVARGAKRSVTPEFNRPKQHYYVTFRQVIIQNTWKDLRRGFPNANITARPSALADKCQVKPELLYALVVCWSKHGHALENSSCTKLTMSCKVVALDQQLVELFSINARSLIFPASPFWWSAYLPSPYNQTDCPEYIFNSFGG